MALGWPELKNSLNINDFIELQAGGAPTAEVVLRLFLTRAQYSPHCS